MNYPEFTEMKMEEDVSIRQSGGISVNFKALFMELLDKTLLIVLVGILCGLLSYLVYGNLIGVSYTSETKVYVLQQSNQAQVSYADLEAGSRLTSDYIEIVKGRTVVEDTIDYFQLEDSYEDFIKRLEVESSVDTRILTIAVTDKDPMQARNEVSYLRDTAIRAIQDSMGLENGLTIVEDANLPVAPVHSALIIGILCGMFAMLIAILVVIVRYLVIDRIVTADDIESRLNMTVLGAITFEDKKKNRHKRQIKQEETAGGNS